MNKPIRTMIVFVVALISNAHAGDQEIRKALSQVMPKVDVEAIKPTEVSRLYEVKVGPNILYVSEDGKYLLNGHLIDIATRKDLTKAKLAAGRIAAIEKLGEDKMIIFKPDRSKYKASVFTGAQTEHKVFIFTDVDCGYCRKLHSQLDTYLAKGITIQYLFYPRAGKDSDSYKKAVSVWCSEDRNKALTEAKQGKDPEPKTCENPVDEHMRLAAEFGISGTPMIVTEKGNVLSGYVSAEQLAKALATE